MNDSTPAISHEPGERKSYARLALVALTALLAAACALFGARPFVHFAKGVRARHFAAQSEALAAESKWPEAFSKAQAAYQLKPDEPDALRAMAHLYEKGRPAAAIPFLRIIAGLDTATARDLREYAELCLLQGNLMEAKGQVSRLLDMQPGVAENLWLAARIYGASGDIDGALVFAGQAEERDPQNATGKLLAARLQTLSGDSETRKSGWKTTWELARGKGPAALDSLHILAGRRDLPPGQQQELVQILHEQPLEEDRLLGSDVELRLHPDRRAEIIDKAIAQAKGASGTSLRILAIWLDALGELQKTLALLPEKLATSRQDLFLVYLDALAGSSRWKDIDRLLAARDLPLDDVYIHAFRARTASEEGRKDDAEFEWKRAHTAATGNPAQMLYVAHYAEKMGRDDQAALAYESLTADFTTARGAYEALLRLAQSQGDVTKVRDLLGEMMKRWDSEPAVRNDYAYMNALLGENLAPSRNIAMGLVSAIPDALAHRTTLALALLRTGDPQSALNVYSGLSIPWGKVPDRDRAVYSAVLGANGKKLEAQTVAASIVPSNLFPQERDLVKPWHKPPLPGKG